MRKYRLLAKHHCNKSKYAISEESNEPNSRYQPKTHFWAQFGPKWANFKPKYFFQAQLTPVANKHHNYLS